ncbi:MAG: hypothetical protein ABI855_07260 [Bacteroidota bacterium]
MKKQLCLLFIFISVTGFFYKAEGQLVKEKFDKLSLSENFDTTSAYWTTVANADNLLIVQEGEYILNRKAQSSPFAIMADFENDLSTFRLVTSIKLEKSSTDEGYTGIIFMMQPGARGGFVFEINKIKQYRVRQLTTSGTYKYITGDSKTGGWMASKFINETNSYNLIEIKTSDRNYDISLNNNYLLSFSEIEYKSGRMGFVIGPGTKGRIDFLYLFSSSKGTESASSNENAHETPVQKEQGGPDIIELTESIIKLKTQINKLTDQNEDLKRTLEAMKGDDEEVENQKKNFQNTIKDLQTEISRSAASYDSLTKVNKELLKYKEMVAGNENSDLIISLSKTVKTEKEANQLLRKQNKELSDSLSILSKNQNQNNPVQEIKPEVKPKQSNDKGFVLPKEGN